MKLVVQILMMGFIPSNIFSYVAMERLSSAPAYARSLVSLEKKANGYSKVLALKGQKAFEKYVVQASQKKPVVLAIYSLGSESESARPSLQLQQAYQKAAENDAIKNKVLFTSLDVSSQAPTCEENKQILALLMQHAGLHKIDLPVVFFFKGGEPYAPIHMPAIAMAGYQSPQALCDAIHKKFFMQPELLVGALQPDFVMTATASNNVTNTRSVPLSAPESTQAKPSFLSRLKGWFKKK